MRAIRKAVITDIDDIKKIYECAFYGREGLLQYYPKFEKYVDFCIEHKFAYAAVEEETVCGVLFAFEVPDIEFGKALYIELLAVLPEYQKRGIGTELLNTAYNVAKVSGFEEISLRTCCYLDAYEIYKKYGFKDRKADMRYMTLKIKKNAEDERY